MARKTKHNDITSPELLAQVNPKNMTLLYDFVEYLRSVQRSDTTIDGYVNDIHIAFVWCLLNNENRFFVEWTKRNIVAYQNWLSRENENSPARIRRMKASLSSMSNYIENVLDDEYPKFRNIINKVESPANQPVREKTVWTEPEVTSMLDKLVTAGHFDKACFFALAAYGGRRKSEICRFTVQDFSESNLVCGGSLYKSSAIKCKGGSGGKFLPCYTLAKKFRPYMEMYMAQRAGAGIMSTWLFPSAANPEEHIRVSTVDSWVRSASKITDRDVYCHSLRHFFTTHLSNEGLPDSVIKEVLGWQDISMVSVYLDRTTDDTLDRYFDADGIKKTDKTELSEL